MCICDGLLVKPDEAGIELVLAKVYWLQRDGRQSTIITSALPFAANVLLKEIPPSMLSPRGQRQVCKRPAGEPNIDSER